MKKNNDSQLIRLYLSFHLNKVVFLLFGIVLILWIMVLIINTGYPFELKDYLAAPTSFHQHYFSQSIFFMEIINGAIVSFLVGAELNSISLFDAMFVANMKRRKIVFAKLTANLILIGWIVLYEVLIMFLVGVIAFSNFKLELNYLLLLPYALLPLIELLLLGECISLLFNSYFIPILIFIVDLICIILIHQTDSITILSNYLPVIAIKEAQFDLQWNISLYSAICMVLLLGILLIFQRKDINY